ncbi:MAG: App1 family protein, partial [Candidatus Riflebacteria bacterium]|nr:App1 family protein [Candidatus Riflebacteria bacterium]
ARLTSPPGSPASPDLGFDALLGEGDSRRFEGSAALVGKRGVSVISDIDDTVKVTDVANRRELLANTFIRPFKAVAGMADAYACWARAGAAFHFVSSSPWQLYPSLVEFFDQERFPRAALHLKLFRFKDSSVLSLLDKPEKHKIPTIEAIIGRFPERTFVLVGDSTEKDPEIYGEIARKHRDRVGAIFIRGVPPSDVPLARFDSAFKDLPRALWTVFHDPGSLKEFDLASLARR